MEDLYIPNCCIHNQLPALLKKHEGRMTMFYSQGDWGINKLWYSISHMVSNTRQTHDGGIKQTGGKIRMMLVVPSLDANIMQQVAEYYNRGWFDTLTLVCFSTTMQPDALMQYKQSIGNALRLIIGRKEAQRQSFWLRYDDQTYNALLVTGPIYGRDSNNPFGQYTAAYHKQLDYGGENPFGRDLVEMVVRPWEHIAKVSEMRRNN